MGSKGIVTLKLVAPTKHHFFRNNAITFSSSQKFFTQKIRPSTTTTTISSLEPPDVPRLAETARISLTPTEVEEFAPKIRQVIDWYFCS